MTDLNEWLKERRTTHDAATKGPWEDTSKDCHSLQVKAGHLTPRYRPEGAPWPQRYDDYRTRLITSDPEGSVWSGTAEDVHAIVDAHNSIPALLTAAENVLELHQPKYLIRDGEWFPANCEVCEPWTWPCTTVQSVRSAIERSE